MRIAVKAAGINFADTMARVGIYPDAPKPPCVLGYEVAGEVESVGEGSTRSKPATGSSRARASAASAELVTVPADQALPLPGRLSFEQGAAVPVNYATAYCGAGRDGRAAARASAS